MTAPIGLTSSSQLSIASQVASASEIKPQHILLTRFPTVLLYEVFKKTVKLNDPALKDLKPGALKAINTYESVSNIQKSPTLLALRGEVHRLKSAWKEAFADFDTAVNRKPDWYYPLGRRGAVLFAMEEDDKALEDLTRAHAMKPDDAFILSYLGECYRVKRDYEKATSFCTKALNIDTTNFRALSCRAECHYFGAGDNKAAEADCKNALLIDPNDGFTLLQMSMVSYADQKWDQALEYLKKTLQNPPFATCTFITLAFVHFHLDNPDAAFSALDRALYYTNIRLEENPNLPFNWEQRGVLYRELHLPEHASSDFNKAQELNPNDPTINQSRNTPPFLKPDSKHYPRFQAYTEALRKKLGPPPPQAPQAPA